MVTLYQFGTAWEINPSPFCMKMETYLRLAGVPYKVRRTMPNKAPRGKLPYIEDKGRIIPDSGEIIEYLKATYGDPLDSGLTHEQRALGHLVRRTLEGSLFFVLAYSRWQDPVGMAVMAEAALEFLNK